MTDTTQGQDAGVETATKRESVAKHELLDASGNVTKRMEEAVGYRFTLRDGGQTFEYAPQDAVAGTPLTMLALFGAKTKATNEASRVRNGANGDAVAQMEAIDEVFDNLNKGIWREKAEGGGGSRIDKRKLAEALIEVLGPAAKGTVDTYQNRLETEDGYLRKVRSNPEVTMAYTRLVGKAAAPIDTLA